MPRKTCFNKHWLTSGSKDNNQVDVSEWCCDVKEDPYSAFCKVCHKRFSIGNMGFAQILSHGDTMKHKSNMKNLQGQAVFKVIHPETNAVVPAPSTDPESAAQSSSAGTVGDVMLTKR
jgi:hypothetical protein